MLQNKVRVYEDKRNWMEYNESLVRRGELYLSLDFLENWDKELSAQNKGKLGRPFEYPESFMEFSAFIHEIFRLPYRQMQGFFRKLSTFITQLNVADYTTMFKRIARIDIQNLLMDGVPENDIVIALDATGVKVTNRGEWMREKWKRRRGWIKVHIAVDVNKKRLTAIEVTDESVGDNRLFKKLVEKSERHSRNKGKLKRVLADADYDTKENFNFLEKKGIESGIKLRKNASSLAKGSPYRAKCVRELRRIGYENWKEKYGYGYRWSAETMFSSVKRIMGEHVTSTSREGMFREVMRKFLFYNMILNTMY